MDGYILTGDELAFRRRLWRVRDILMRYGAAGISKPELTKRTNRMLAGVRERDDILATLHDSGMVVVRITAIPKKQPKIHYWAAEFAPQEDGQTIGVWGGDQGW
jgi:hypothetical protein